MDNKTVYKRLNIGDSAYIYSDTIIIDKTYDNVVFVSAVGYNYTIKQIEYNINKNSNIYIESEGYYKSGKNMFEITKHKEQNNDFLHIFITKKDEVVKRSDEENIVTYIFYRNKEERRKMLYKKIYSLTSVPVLEEWMPKLETELQNRNYLREIYSNNDNISSSYLYLSEDTLKEIISKALKEKTISLNGSNEPSEMIQYIDGLDQYLQCYGDILAEKIQESFKPKFIPGEDQLDDRVIKFDDNCFYKSNVDLFDAQRAVIQSNVNNFKTEKVGLVIGEMGVGNLLCA